ncbi:MAG: cupin domain-containing protein [Aquabacterium sp.]|uniref:cupin domain-containing protein n=1 Tax=Aquabacterium sp. TaxID=1872578 RepID=UPI0025C0BCA9|nr:cupin domain-containing protein [Aquabacterium sp.]MBI3382075.1 cupin domain-containing protein [Aquabacterium sp.]
MKVNDDARPKASPIPGIAHITLASHADGLSELSVWRQTMSPGAATPPHHHDCDEVVLCLAGWGEVHSHGQVQRFGADATLILPAGRDHQIFNVGPTPLETIGILAATPVVTRQPDGVELTLPWNS